MGPSGTDPNNAAEIARLRQIVPPQILAHYDRLRSRDKKGVALVRGGVCTECHMKLASGLNADLIRNEDLLICDSCGRYLVAGPDDLPAEEPAKALPEKPRRTKKKKEEPAV